MKRFKPRVSTETSRGYGPVRRSAPPRSMRAMSRATRRSGEKLQRNKICCNTSKASPSAPSQLKSVRRYAARPLWNSASFSPM